MNAYTTMEHEVAGKLRGLDASHGFNARLRCRMESVWFKLFRFCERRTYRDSDLVLVNYESVRQLLTEKYGTGLTFATGICAGIRLSERLRPRRPRVPSRSRPRAA